MSREPTPTTARPTPPSRPAARPAAEPVAPSSTLLVAVLSSEDALFQDPFADFRPSAR